MLRELRHLGHDHPEPGLQGGVPHTRPCAAGVDLKEDREQDPGELGPQPSPYFLLVPAHGVTGVSQVHCELLVAGPGTGQADLALLGQEGTLKHPAVVVAVGVPRVSVVLQRVHSVHTVTWDPGKQL